MKRLKMRSIISEILSISPDVRSGLYMILLVLCYNNISVNSYNLSPKPNSIIKDPQLAPVMPKYESSYFGYTLLLRPSGIFVGAPRAQSTLASQRNINETGAIYRCNISDKTCNPYVFEDQPNIISEYDDYLYNSEKRDFQWLGAAMDGGPSDNDKLIVCAPRLIAPIPSDYLMHGICYWVNNTINANRPEGVFKISLFRLRQDQVREENNVRSYYYMLGEQGFSAHITADNEEFLIGAPGIHTWKGSVIRYRKQLIQDDPSLSRRDVHSVSRSTRQSDSMPPKVYYGYDIPNPETFDQSNDAYFGYSVSSGYFDSDDRQRLMYLASAPQANEQSGEAYVYDYTKSSIDKKYIFKGEQFGEYFGYAVLAEDINGDGLTDVIVSAPQHSITGSFDDGAIYVFINQGRFNFERKLMISPVHGKARFGTTLTKLGDINHDGYNDIAVGAPFAGNGAVFVYLGSGMGLRNQPSQRLNSPITTPSNYGAHMFGHGLSKGNDIDKNGFNDFAIGAPNAESVFVYRAYPVVKIHATINSQIREIRTDQTTFPISICYKIETTSNMVKAQDIALRAVVDPQVKRVKITSTNSNEMIFNVTAGTELKCSVWDCSVRYSIEDIFKPIELELHYEIIKGVPDSEVFCDTCVAVDPAEPKVYSEKIIFSTGCASEICVADMQVKSTGLDHAYILGSSRTLTVTYEISNYGETAYLPQINITSSNRMSFAKVPSNCKLHNYNVVMLCDIFRGQPMGKNGKDSITVIYDASGISGTQMILTAKVFSTGKEKTPENNIINDVITLKEFTEIEAVGAPKTAHINLEKVHDSAEVINFYEIRSNGPSNVDSMEITFNIPVAYKVPGSSVTIPIIDMNNITMQAVRDGQLVGIDFYQNNTQIIMNAIEISGAASAFSSSVTKTIIETSNNGIHYDSTKMGHEFGMTNDDLGASVMTASMTRRSRSRRDAAALTATKDQYVRIARAHDLLSDDLKGTLPVNRTIVFNCNDPEITVCVRAVMHVYQFKPEKPITISMKYNVDLKEVNQILSEPWEFFVILVGLDVMKTSDPLGGSIALTKKIEYNIISKHQLYGTPIWVIILAVLGGLLALALITYGMYKAGFFKRATKEEMDKLVHQAQVSSDGVTEASNLNEGDN